MNFLTCVFLLFTQLFEPYPIGGILRFNRGSYDHYAIYAGLGKVYHYSGEADTKTHSDAVIRLEKLSKVAADSPVVLDNRHDADTETFGTCEIIRRAESRLGEEEYDLLSNNCEHFANWCRYGKHMSTQAESKLSSATRYVLKTEL